MVNLLFSWVYLGDGTVEAAGATVGAGEVGVLACVLAGVGDFNLVTVPSRNVPKEPASNVVLGAMPLTATMLSVLPSLLTSPR